MPEPTTTAEPLFRDAEAAVKFAFAICEMSACPKPAYLKELVRANAKKNQRTVGMSALDWHAEGLLIRKRVQNAPYPLAAYGFARYSWVDSHRTPTAEVVVQHVTACMPAVKNRKLLVLLVQRYLNQGRAGRQRRSEIARAAGVHASWCDEIDKRVSTAIDTLHFDLFARLTEQMVEAGLIPAD